ncbi:transcription factor bHLH153 isoform X2 [Spinacia oleracea]|uniref:Transcription factor bHLH153 isoform X2 n=1 Tax=Spinacia oleracea TaxID=3562 RepID=A0ABM3RIA0_SPIOL|nr:transcription factor bHLH153 isoform X2 [Spinacia oleracea]
MIEKEKLSSKKTFYTKPNNPLKAQPKQGGTARWESSVVIESSEMTELKRTVRPIDQDNFTSIEAKRQKVDLSMSSKERKEKLGEKITTLQQLVSPYGKTDTASVLFEAMEYIRFLHEQVKVLSAPYLHNTPVTNIEEAVHYNLRSKGLCLVPIECTAGLAGSNGADIWAPIKTGSPRF